MYSGRARAVAVVTVAISDSSSALAAAQSRDIQAMPLGTLIAGLQRYPQAVASLAVGHRLASVMLGLDGPVVENLRWRVGLGGLFYLPSEDRGIFLEGGPIRFVAGAGADWRRPVMTKWDLMVSARYDLHRFTTDELEQRGFSQAQGVSRVSLAQWLGLVHETAADG